ncbi:MAG TPA: CDP-alcohol phosphatidyltransferase family protein [Candidatus Dormibacteraeota bacterium]
MRLSRTGGAGVAYFLFGLAWVLGASPPGPAWAYVVWFAIVAGAGSFVPGVANQVSLARAYLAAPALAYSLEPGQLGYLAVAIALAGLTDLVDGTIARRFDRPSSLGGALDPVVDGVFMGAVTIGLASGGAIPWWLAAVVVLRYALPTVVGGLLIAIGRAPELRHTLTGQISTVLNLVLIGGIALLRGLNQDPGALVVGAEVAIPIAAVATWIHLAWAAGQRRRPVAAPGPG